MYLTSQNMFLENLRYKKLIIFSLQEAMVSVRNNYHFKKQYPQKISGYSPDVWQEHNSR